MIHENISLKHCNTFRIDVQARYFIELNNINDLLEVLQDTSLINKAKLVLGGGSNILFTKDYEGFVIKNNIKGINIIEDKKDAIIVEVGGGEEWHTFVLWCIDNGYAGVENLSLIPGTVGAAPVQNIGAYGVELKDIFVSLEAVHLETGKRQVFDKSACEFAYRNSIFKNRLKGQYCITSVCFKLQKQAIVNTSYGAIQTVLNTQNIQKPTIVDISKAVIQIREQKLPNPKVIGNAGSFFKNPIISESQSNKLKQQYPDIVIYKLGNGMVKVPAGWLIERAGWKGKKVGNTGAYKNQALVLVNYGSASGKEIFELAKTIKKSIKATFDIDLEMEVNVL